jgi:aminoglycoside 3-N-acetyltransferase
MEEDFIHQLRALGINSGDVLLVHSSMKALKTKKSPQGFILDILNVIGPEGTLLVPALTYDNVNARQPHFSILTTEPCIGLLPKTFFRMDGVIRSMHPTHSVCAYGKYAAEICSEHWMDETPVGPHSPFMKLLDYQGKLLFIGDILKSCTFMHGMEEKANVPYVLEKERTHYFMEKKDGTVTEKDMFAHNFKGWEQQYQRIKGILHHPEIKIGKIGQADCFLINSTALAEKAIEKFIKDPYYFVTKGIIV